VNLTSNNSYNELREQYLNKMLKVVIKFGTYVYVSMYLKKCPDLTCKPNMAICGFALYSFFLIAARAYLGLKIKQ
jgi:hypothetical protein